MKEILGHVPNWITRWGILVFLIAFLLLLIGSWVYKYPDIIVADVFITTENPPSRAIARVDGRIMNLFVQDSENVRSGTVLAIIENPSRYSDVKMLKSHLDSFKIAYNFRGNEFITFPPELLLGDLQSYYAGFLKLYDDLHNFVILDYHQKKINSLLEEIKRYRNYSVRLINQCNILRQEETLTAKQYKRDSLLFQQAVIPEAEFEKTRGLLLQKKYNLEQSLITHASNEIQISKLEQQILDLELQKSQDRNKLELLLNESLDNLVAQISLWEQKYVIKASVDGIVSFTNIWSEHQNVRVGDLVMTVIPENQGEIIGKMNLPVKGAGKVKEGQRVNIKFSNYPYMEFGMVSGRIYSISLVTSDNLYSVLVRFNEGLKTNYGIVLDFKQDIQGIAEIITDDKRLLERIIYPVKSIIKKQKMLTADS